LKNGPPPAKFGSTDPPKGPPLVFPAQKSRRPAKEIVVVVEYSRPPSTEDAKVSTKSPSKQAVGEKEKPVNPNARKLPKRVKPKKFTPPKDLLDHNKPTWGPCKRKIKDRVS